MSAVRSDDLKNSSFATRAVLAARQAGPVKTVQVKVDHKAATRQAVILDIRRNGVEFRTRSDWKAKAPSSQPAPDWHYKAIALHHAGNSYSCAVDGAAQMRKAEATDIDSFGQLSYHYAIDCHGVIYEALDIRFRGAHVEGGNTGVVGIVFLADFSVAGEAGKYGPGVDNVRKKRGVIAGVREWLGVRNDDADTDNDKPSESQLRAASVLVKTLQKYFAIEKLGGHREFARTHGSSRACPGTHGMAIAESLRRDLKLGAP